MGGIDILILNAGRDGGFTTFEQIGQGCDDADDEDDEGDGVFAEFRNVGICVLCEWRVQALPQIMDVNYWGCVYPTYYALSHLQKSKGKIMVVSSLAGYTGRFRVYNVG